MLGDEFPHGRYEVNRNLHRRARGGLERGLVFGDRRLVALGLAVLKEAPHADLIPTGWELALLSHGFLLRRRRSRSLGLGAKEERDRAQRGGIQH